jgi:general secretion pathway protein F
MIQVGEESGEMDSLLAKVADTYDLETRNAIDRLVALLVPVLTLGMAAAVAVIILSVLMPIYDMTGNMG